MYFYHEGYHDAYYAAALEEDLRSGDRRVDDRSYEPIGIPALLNWLVIVSVALCVIFAAIHPQGGVGIPMLTTIALAFAALREWRGSIIAPMVCHACVNGVTVTMLVLITA